MKKYQIIYADPPWEYKSKRRFLNKERQINVFIPNSQGVAKYPSMSLNEICKIPIKNITEKNCVLFLWTTTPYLEKSFEVINAWGFKYKTIGFVWLKTWHGKIKKPLKFYMNSVYGMNYYTKLQFELCLLAVKGSMPPISHKVSGQIIADRKKHSQKPTEARDKILQLMGDLPRIELFAREKTEGWDVWGNEVESDMDLMGIK